MSSVKIGWYSVESSFEHDGIHVAVLDRRTNKVYSAILSDLESFNDLVVFLSTHQTTEGFMSLFDKTA